MDVSKQHLFVIPSKCFNLIHASTLDITSSFTGLLKNAELG